MSLYITSLNSGSNGNCYYVGNDTEAVLVDAGISCREIEKRMKRLGLAMHKVKAVFISHEHSDHIRGLTTIAKKYQLPVYITTTTLQFSGLSLHSNLAYDFIPHKPIVIGSLSITAFPKYHDASDPYSFMISCNGINVGVFTDIGAPCAHLVSHFGQCHAAFLEANYDEEMLMNGGYPYYLKKRISGGKGHLSNMQALELFRKNRSVDLSHLVLSHLSKNNNCPDLVGNLFNRHAEGVKIVVASRYEETELMHITGSLETSIRPTYEIAAPQLQFAFA